MKTALHQTRGGFESLADRPPGNRPPFHADVFFEPGGFLGPRDRFGDFPACDRANCTAAGFRGGLAFTSVFNDFHGVVSRTTREAHLGEGTKSTKPTLQAKVYFRRMSAHEDGLTNRIPVCEGAQ